MKLCHCNYQVPTNRHSTNSPKEDQNNQCCVVKINNVLIHEPLQTYSVEFSIDSQIPYPVCSCPDGFELICHVQNHLAESAGTRNWREGERRIYQNRLLESLQRHSKTISILVQKGRGKGRTHPRFSRFFKQMLMHSIFLNKQMINLSYRYN